MMRIIYLILVIGTFYILACKKQEDDVQINISVENSPVKTGVNRSYTITENRFYLSNFKLIEAGGNVVTIKDVILVKNANSTKFTFKMPSGNFTKFSYAFGLDKTTNNSNPSTFADVHPLSTKQDMYWGMLKYRFIVTEGKLDSSIAKNQTPSQPYSMHLGSDTLYRTITTDLTDKGITKGSVINIRVNLNKLFVLDEDVFDINNFSNHSDASQIPRAISIVDSLINGIKTEIFTPN